jgi:hypothetical protein
VACFLALQEIRLDPRYTAKPPALLLPSGHPTQSASENALTSIDGDLLIHKPSLRLPLIYRSILFTIAQRTAVGA